MLSNTEFQQKQIIFALLSRGEKLSFRNDNIIISDNEGIKHQSTCYRLFALFIVGHVSVTSGLLQRAKRFGFSVYLLSHNLGPYASWNSSADGNTLLRKKQYLYENDYSIARHLIKNKISSQISVLEKRRKKRPSLKEAIQSLHKYRNNLIESSPDLHGILGLEGIASRVYFSFMFDEMNWKGRRPRVKHDITNLLLDIGYTQLFNIVESLLNLYGFDVYQGVYHQVFYQRKSLVCDLVEPFRPIVDQQIRNAYRRNAINPKDFSRNRGQYSIYGEKAKPYVNNLLKEILKYKEDIFLYIQKYYRAFMRDKPINEYPVFEIK